MNRLNRAYREAHPVRGVCVFLAAMAVAMLAVASRIEQPPVQVADALPSLSIASTD